MRMKYKLTLGIVFIFVEFLVMALLGAYSIYNISKQTEKIVKDNNLSIQYAENMLQTIDQINASQLAILFNPSNPSQESELAGLYGKFEDNLGKEANNVTEPGEKEVLTALTGEYRSYKVSIVEMDAIKHKADFYFQKLLAKHHSLKAKIYNISDMNMQAILKKNERVNSYERRSYVILTIIASLCFFLSITFIFNFPRIFDPLKQLAEGLKGIASGHYDLPLSLGSNGEFVEMEQAARTIAARLKKYESGEMEAVIRKKEGLVRTIDQALDRLQGSQDRIRNLEIRRIMDEQSDLIDMLKKELEQTKLHLAKG
jgi:nitrate/nitrite-specific signal transduction histidine kinase